MDAEFTRLARDLNRAALRRRSAEDALTGAQRELHDATDAAREAEKRFLEHATKLAAAVGTDG